MKARGPSIRFWGHACFELLSRSGHRLLIDPYEQGLFEGAFRYAPIQGVFDNIEITHDHADHNAVHVVQGGPIANHLTPYGVDPNERFQESGVASVLFQEYSESMPHVPYSVGMSGRPSGPNFYFNVQDNSKLHGPGGYAKDGSADPCFGRVVRGQDAIDTMHQLNGGVNPGEWKELDPKVAVRWVKLLN